MTSTPPPNSEEALFARALALPAAERAAFLDRECAGDAALRTRLEALLHSEADGGFMLGPAVDFAATVVRPAPLPEEKSGDRIGRYKLLQKIGEGGCGIVNMAEQQEPVVRRVALKVIKLGMDTKILTAVRNGDPRAAEQLMPLMGEPLRRLRWWVPLSEHFLRANRQRQRPVHAQRGHHRASQRRPADHPNAVPLKVLAPQIDSGIEERRFTSGFGVDRGLPVAFAQRARNACQREVLRSRFSPPALVGRTWSR